MILIHVVLGQAIVNHNSPANRGVPAPGFVRQEALLWPYTLFMNTDWLFWAGGAAIGLAGIALATWALFADRSRGRRRCPKCWYDLSKTEGLRCSECGHRANREAKLFKTRRRWKWVAVSLAFLLTASASSVQPKVNRTGWISLVPTALLFVGVPGIDVATELDEIERRVTVYKPGACFGYPDYGMLSDWEFSLLQRRCERLALSEDHLDDRILAIHTLGYMNPNRQALADLLRRLLEDPLPEIRMESLQTTASLQWEWQTMPRAFVEAILSRLHDADALVRLVALDCIASNPPISRQERRLLITQLMAEDSDDEVRAAAESEIEIMDEMDSVDEAVDTP